MISTVEKKLNIHEQNRTSYLELRHIFFSSRYVACRKICFVSLTFEVHGEPKCGNPKNIYIVELLLLMVKQPAIEHSLHI